MSKLKKNSWRRFVNISLKKSNQILYNVIQLAQLSLKIAST